MKDWDEGISAHSEPFPQDLLDALLAFDWIDIIYVEWVLRRDTDALFVVFPEQLIGLVQAWMEECGMSVWDVSFAAVKPTGFGHKLGAVIPSKQGWAAAFRKQLHIPADTEVVHISVAPDGTLAIEPGARSTFFQLTS